MERLRVAVARGALKDFDSIAHQVSDQAELLEFDPGPHARPAAEALVVALQRVDADLLNSFGESLRVVGRAGIGLDSVDLEAARERGIAVINEPDYATEEVATHALALLLAVHRQLAAGDAAARHGWFPTTGLGSVAPLSELTLGVIGAGRIGRHFVRIARALFRDILVCDPFADLAPEGTTATDLDDLIRRSAVVSMHLPLTPTTRHLLDASRLRLMRPGAVVINVSRGGLIDEEALARALASGELAGAGLDVFEQEPLAASSPLLSAPNILLTPHVAWASSRAGRRLADWIVSDVLAYLSGERLPHGHLVVGNAFVPAETTT